MTLLTPAQSAVYTSVMQGNSVIWLTGRQEGKTYIGARCLYALSGIMVAGNGRQADNNKQDFPDLVHYAPYRIKEMTRETSAYAIPQLVVFDNFEMYDYHTLTNMMRVEAKQKLYMASHWSSSSVQSTNYEVVIRALMARGYKLFST